MAASLIFLFAATAQNSGASRYNPPAHPLKVQAAHGLAVHTGSLSGGSVRAPLLHMQTGQDDRDVPEAWKPGLKYNWRDGLASKEEWNYSDLERISARGAFPPTTIARIAVGKLLQSWERSLWKSGARQRATSAITEVAMEQKTLSTTWKDMLFVLQKMKYDTSHTRWMRSMGLKHHDKGSGFSNVSSRVPTLHQPQHEQATGMLSQSGIIESVGLISNDQFADDASVMALAVFSREQLEDNSKRLVTSYHHLPKWLKGSWGSKLLDMLPAQPSTLLKMVETQLGMEATRGMFGLNKKSVPVFAIEGLAEAPDLSSRSARVLLAKIAKWAQNEKRLVVVARHAVHFGDGTDLTEYYMRLGFIKLEMDDGSYELVYGYRCLDFGYGCLEFGYTGISASGMLGTGALASTSDPERWLEYRQDMVSLEPWVPYKSARTVKS